MAASTFKLGLPLHSKLRDFLTMHQLMRPIEEHNRLEDNRLQNKGKAPTAFQYQKESQIRRLSTKAQKGGWGPHKG